MISFELSLRFVVFGLCLFCNHFNPLDISLSRSDLHFLDFTCCLRDCESLLVGLG